MKMKLLLYVFIAFIIGILLSTSCVEKMTHLSKKDMEWVNAYHEGDTVIYKSNKGNIDTMIVDRIDIKDNWIPFVTGTSPGAEKSIGSASIHSTINHRGVHMKYNIWIARTDYIGPLTYRVILDNRISTPLDRDVYPIIKLINKNMTIDDNNSEMLIGTDSVLGIYKREYGSNIKKARLHKEKGLLFYEFEDGERFTFFKRIHKSSQR